VIAVPTSVGYGASFGGIAALLRDAQLCAAGVTVVNIDNGFGAGCAAARINHLARCDERSGEGVDGVGERLVLEGRSAGAARREGGDLVFNTAMTGYHEILTDPSYYGQVVVMTYPLIGNYGVAHEDDESEKAWPRPS
jgi:hypothetical protein